MANRYCSVKFKSGEELDRALEAALGSCEDAARAERAADTASQNAREAEDFAQEARGYRDQAENATTGLSGRVQSLERNVSDVRVLVHDAQDDVSVLQRQVADLMYVPIELSNFTHNVGTKERGEVVREVTLTWSINKTPETLTLRTTIGGSVSEEVLDVSAQSKTVSTYISESNTYPPQWMLTATDERERLVSKQTPGFTFRNCVYYGAADDPRDTGGTIDSEFIMSLAETGAKTEPTGTRVRKFTIPGDGKYIWYCLPTELGKCTFTSGGITAGVTLVATKLFKNALEYAEPYYVYRSNQKIKDTLPWEVS